MAAYDYLTYMQLMRWSGKEPSVVDYLFTGQEWDRETGFYIFHFGLYQIDPKKKKFRLENLRLRRKLAAVPRSSRRSICSNDMFVSYHFRLHWSLSRSSGRKRKLRS